MTKKLSVSQRYSLLRGFPLMVELPSATSDCRAFLLVRVEEEYKSLYLNVNYEPVFWMKTYQIPSYYIENDLDIADAISDEKYFEDIKGYDMLEKKLLCYIDDLSKLVSRQQLGVPY